MRVLQVAVLLASSLCALAASNDGPDGSVTTAGANAPAYLVGVNVYSTSTLYTTSYYVITECAPYASDCPTNALTVVTSVVFASSTTTVCLATDLPQAALPPATGTLPSYAFTTTNKPTGSDTAIYPGASSSSRSGQLPAIPSFGIPVGPGPEITPQPSPSPPYASGTGAPSASNSRSSAELTHSSVLTSLPGSAGSSSPVPGYSNTQSYGLPSPPVSGTPSSSAFSAPSAISPGASSSNPIPGVPPRPHPSFDSSLIPSYGVSSALRPSAGPSLSRPNTAPNSGSSNSIPTLANPTWNPVATRPSLSFSGPNLPAVSGGPSQPYGSAPSSLGSIGSSFTGSSTVPITGTASLSSLWTGPTPIPGSGGPINTLPSAPTSGLSTQHTSSASFPVTGSNVLESPSLAKSSPYASLSTGSVTSALRTTSSSANEGTTTTQLTSIITLPHTTFVYTVPAQTSGRNYSTETLGLHTSIGTDASAYIPTGSGLWPSATNNGTVVSPTPTSPMPINNEGPQTFASGKSAFIAIVGALAFAHFAHIN